MGFRIEAPKQDGNARFDTLKVNLNENNSATRTVVADTDGNFYYGAGGGGGTGGTNGTSGTSGPTGGSGTSGTSGTGFNTISNPADNRVLTSLGTTDTANAETNLIFDGTNLGIGTITPSVKLHVSGGVGIFSGTADQILTLDATDSSWSYIGYSWAGVRRFYTGLDSSGKYAFGSDSGAIFYFTGASVGVGNTSPSTLLTVGNTSGDNGGITVLADNTSNTYDVFSGQRKYPRISLIDSIGGGSTFQIWNLGNQLRFGTNAGSSTLSAFNIDAGDAANVIFNGSVGIKTPTPSYALDVLGTIRATGDVIAFSDARVKDNVETITDALNKVKSLRGVSYTRNDSEDKSLKIGIIAQEVLKVLPEVVQQDSEGNYSVAYGNMVGLLIEAIKEQQQQIEELKYLLKKQ
jgi:hypothetical protein